MIRFSWDLLPVVAHPGPPRAIIEPKANRHPAGAGAVFLYVADPYESKLSTAHRHTKKSHNIRCAICFCFVIRLGFAKVQCFTVKSYALLSSLLVVKVLVYN